MENKTTQEKALELARLFKTERARILPSLTFRN